jgi:hypothetical protein
LSLEQAQNLDAPLTEYAAAYNLDVKDLYAGKAQLVKKGLLPGRTATPERAVLAFINKISPLLIRFTNHQPLTIQSLRFLY